jgi:hypothetical protein
MANSRESLLQEFVDWARDHITGDEKGEAQIFLDRLFRAFGQKGSLDVGGTPELRIRKASEDGGGTAFADYVWKPIVVIEMKKRGTDLAKTFRQAFDYWVRLVPNRPQYVVLCNFDEFWVYDFNNQIDSPKDKVKLRGGRPLMSAAFLFCTTETHIPHMGDRDHQRLVIVNAVSDTQRRQFVLPTFLTYLTKNLVTVERLPFPESHKY